VTGRIKTLSATGSGQPKSRRMAVPALRAPRSLVTRAGDLGLLRGENSATGRRYGGAYAQGELRRRVPQPPLQRHFAIPEEIERFWGVAYLLRSQCRSEKIILPIRSQEPVRMEVERIGGANLPRPS
jgi:hypothetical protein